MTPSCRRFPMSSFVVAFLVCAGVLAPSASAQAPAMTAAAQAQAAGGFDSVAAPKKGEIGSRVPLRKGMHGKDVVALQKLLRQTGIRTSTDGEFGTSTAYSVRLFERRNGLPVNGKLDANDVDVLKGQAAATAAAARTSTGTAAAATPATPAPAALAPGDRATINPDGTANAPANAPDAVKAMIAAGNVIAKTPYIYGGGHGKWDDAGYDCSGSVSYALHAAGLLEASMPSGNFTTWGEAGPGQWVTLYANGGHIYATIAGLRFDTSGATEDGSRWHTSSRPTSGYVVRHPAGL